MMNFSTTHYSGVKYQNGAALIISLMMLIVMTILAVNAITTTTMQEKMAGNIRNKHISFQAAEAALRAGEDIAQAVTDDSLFSSAGTNGYYSVSLPGDTNPDYPIWTWEGTPAINWQTISTNTGAVQSPEYIVEDFGTDYRDADCALIVPLPPGCELPIYRISARGWGLNTNGYTLLQSTYKQL